MSALRTAQLDRPLDVSPSAPATVYDRHIAELVASAALLFAFDAAFPAPGAVYRANGGIAANVYVSGNYAQDATHVRGLRAAGVAPWPNYEVGLWELVSNRPAGQAAGRRGIADAIRCSFPANGTIWFPFSVDVSVDPTRYNQVAEAFRGIQDVNAGRYLISFYGQGGLAAYLRQNRIINQKCWLSASTSFPGYNASSPDICVWQQVGNFIPGYSTDRNVITDPYALNAWWPDGSPYGGSEVVTQADADLIAKTLWNWLFSPGGVDLDTASHVLVHAYENALAANKTASATLAAVNVVKANTDTVEATQILQNAQMVALKQQLAATTAAIPPAAPTLDAIITRIKSDVPGWEPTPQQLAAIAADIAGAIEPPTYESPPFQLTPTPPAPPAAS